MTGSGSISIHREWFPSFAKSKMGKFESVVKLLAHNKQFKVNYKVLNFFEMKLQKTFWKQILAGCTVEYGLVN